MLSFIFAASLPTKFKSMLTNEKFIANAAKALGDKNRLTILQNIARRGSLTITEVQQLTKLAQPSISYHIKLLLDSELVVATKTGRTVNLSLSQEKINLFREFFQEVNHQASKPNRATQQEPSYEGYF